MRWKVIIGLGLALTISKLSVAENNNSTIYWYLNGEKQTWTPQGNATLRVDGSVNTDQSTGIGTLKTNPIIKSGNTSYIHLQLPTDATAEQEYLDNLKKEYPTAHLMISFLDATGKQVSIDDRIFISFKENMSSDDVAAFATQYDLALENPRPAYLPVEWKYVYIFHQNHFSTESNSAVLSAQIYEQEAGKVAFANPNRSDLPGKGFSPDGVATNDADLDYAWFLNNHGQRVVCASNGGTSGNDAKVTEAWGLGYNGQGIKIGVVDFGGFDYQHPDMQGQILPGWNCVTNTPYNAANAAYDATFKGHGMAVAGILGANANNNIGSAGIAYGAKIIPFYVNGQEDAQLVIAMQKAADPAFDVDVLNFSLGIDHPSDAIKAQITNLATAGRVRYGVNKGVVMVASHGNNGSFDGTAPQWPAAYPQVISVGGSTPDDKLKVTGDTWNLGSTAWASNYGNNMAVVAPSVCIFTTDMTGGTGYSNNEYAAFGQTSAAAPIVAGIAALLLSKNGNLSYDAVKNAIANTADKVHPELYNYQEDNTLPGHNQQMGYGRVNAFTALKNLSTGITEKTIDEKCTFLVTNPVERVLAVQYRLPDNSGEATVAVYDMSGKMLLTHTLAADEQRTNIDMRSFAPGMYFARFTNKQDQPVQTMKFIKID